MLKPGFLITAPPGQRKAVIDVAQELEHRGFSHIFCPHDTTPAVLHGVAAPYDSLSLCTAMIQATNRIKVGSGVAITYTRHPAEMAAAAAFNHEISGGRFYLGLGPSHDIILKHFNIESEKPLGHMRGYVAQVRAAAAGQPMPPIILGALRRKMVHLAGEIADGVLGANWALSHVPESLNEIPKAKPDTFLMGHIVPVWICEDRREGLSVFQRWIAYAMTMANYARYYREAGYVEEVERSTAATSVNDTAAAEAAISERMAEDIGIFGTPPQVRERIEEWQAAGVNWLTLQPVYSSRASFSSKKGYPAAIMALADIFK